MINCKCRFRTFGEIVGHRTHAIFIFSVEFEGRHFGEVKQCLETSGECKMRGYCPDVNRIVFIDKRELW